MDKFLTKENIIIVVVVFVMLVQSNYFATKLDIANVRLEIAKTQDVLKDYSDRADKEILKEIKAEFQTISDKIDKKHNQ